MGNELFLSLFNYAVKTDLRLRAIIKTISQNATYTSHDMQNEVIAAMSSVVTKGIEQEIGNSRYTIKVDGTKNSTSVKYSTSVALNFHNYGFFKRAIFESRLVLSSIDSGDAESITDKIFAERFLVLSSTDSVDAESITDMILAELTKAGLTLSKILSQFYNGALVTAGHCGGV